MGFVADGSTTIQMPLVPAMLVLKLNHGPARLVAYCVKYCAPGTPKRLRVFEWMPGTPKSKDVISLNAGLRTVT